MNAGQTDPWSSDDVPVAPRLDDIVWDTPAGGDTDQHEAGTSRAGPGSGRRILVPTLAVAAIGIVLLSILAWPDGNNTEAEEPRSSSPVTPTTLDSLPPATVTAPPTTVAPEGEPSAVDVVAETSPVIELADGELPPSLAAADVATDVVVVTSEGELVTLSLPNGDVTERVDLRLNTASQFDSLPGNLVLAPDSTLYSTETELVLVGPDRAALAIDRDDFRTDESTSSFQLFPLGWTTDTAGATVFVVMSFDRTGTQSEWLLTSTGDVTPAPAQRSGLFARPIYALGTRFIDDAGGAYRVDPNGDSNRISPGQILATSQTRLLLRECDARRVCTAVLRDYDGAEVRIVNLPPTFRPYFLAASLSPDGSAVTYGEAFLGSRTIIDLDSGETMLFEEESPEIAQPTWASDSSGIFALGSDDGIRFLERSTGEEFSFASGLGEVRAIATRTSSS